jgi:hypothetical protein
MFEIPSSNTIFRMYTILIFNLKRIERNMFLFIIRNDSASKHYNSPMRKFVMFLKIIIPIKRMTHQQKRL